MGADKNYVLVDDKTGEPVKVGDIVTDFRGDSYAVTGWEAPHSPASTGRVHLRSDEAWEHGYFPSVINAHLEPVKVNRPVGIQITKVSAFGEGLRSSIDDIKSEVVVSGDFNGGVAIDFDNGLTLYVGDRDGYGPTQAWLERDGEPVLPMSPIMGTLDQATQITIPER